jgi:hypothetical protein
MSYLNLKVDFFACIFLFIFATLNIHLDPVIFLVG